MLRPIFQPNPIQACVPPLFTRELAHPTHSDEKPAGLMMPHRARAQARWMDGSITSWRAGSSEAQLVPGILLRKTRANWPDDGGRRKTKQKEGDGAWPWYGAESIGRLPRTRARRNKTAKGKVPQRATCRGLESTCFACWPVATDRPMGVWDKGEQRPHVAHHSSTTTRSCLVPRKFLSKFTIY